MSLLGLTLDYGPFGFWMITNPVLLFVITPDQGRYSFDNQPARALEFTSYQREALLSPFVAVDCLKWGHGQLSSLGFF